MAKTALITGASSGLGTEYARQLAARGADLVLVARDRAELERLGAELVRDHGISYEVLAVDLTKPRQLQKVTDRLADVARPIEMLVNNAGFGLDLAFESNDIEDEARHLALHVEVPMRLMRAVLPGMLERGSGRIVNIASVAGFIPLSTYGAPRGVTVTAVCPGFTHTGFHERMGLAPGNEGVPAALWLDASDVVSESLRDIARGKAVSVPSLRYKALVALTRLVPPNVAARVGESGR